MRVSDIVSRLGPICREVVETRYLDVVGKALGIDLSVDESLVEMLKALANANRLRIVKLLVRIGKPVPLCLVAAILNLDMQNLVYHVKALKDAGIVKELSLGKLKLLEVDRDALSRALAKLSEALDID